MIKEYRRVLAIIAVLIFFTNLAVYLSFPDVASVPPLYFIISFATLAGPICLSRGSFALARRSPIITWCYAFMMVSAVWLLVQQTPSETAWQAMRTRVLSVFVLLILLYVFCDENAQRWARRAILCAVIMAVAINLYELFHPLTFSMVKGRSAGLYYNPNQCGAALVLGMIMSIGLLRQRYRLCFVFIIGLGVVLTVSRGAIVSWCVVLLSMVLNGQISLKRSLVFAVAILASMTALVTFQWDRVQYELTDIGVLNKDISQRIESFVNPQDFAGDDSAAQRKEVLNGAWEMFADRPIWGYGVAASRDWGYEISSHNQYLSLMVDHGILGFFILPLIVLATIWRARGTARQIGSSFAAFILCWGFFSHNVLEEYYILLSFSLIASISLLSNLDQGLESLRFVRTAPPSTLPNPVNL